MPFDRPFTWAEAQAAGLTKHQLRTRAYRHVFRDVWVPAHVADDRWTRLAAVKLVLPPQAVLCGLTAAWIYGADVRRDTDLDVHVAFPEACRRRPRQGMVVRQMTLASDDVWMVGAAPVTSPTRTVVDCLRLLPDPTGVVVADALAYRRVTTLSELRTYVTGQRGVRNLRRAARLLDEVEPLTESRMETHTRLRLVRAGLPRPEAQVEVFDHGAFVARVDLAYPHLKIAIEYDGAWHWEQRRADDRRRARLRELGWTVIVVSAEDIFSRDGEFVAEVGRALAARRG